MKSFFGKGIKLTGLHFRLELTIPCLRVKCRIPSAKCGEFSGGELFNLLFNRLYVAHISPNLQDLSRACRLASIGFSDSRKEFGLLIREKFESLIPFRSQYGHCRSIRKTLRIDHDHPAKDLSSGNQHSGILALQREAVQRPVRSAPS